MIKKIFSRLLLFNWLLILALSGYPALAGSDVTFVERAEELGVDDVNDGLAASLADWDNDGDPDLLIQNRRETDWIIFYQNDILTEGKFTRLNTREFLISEDAYVGPDQGRGYSWSAAWADFDQDGDVDVFLGQDGDAVQFLSGDLLLVNEGGKFYDRTEQFGVKSWDWAQGVQWVDFDRDGRLDLHVTKEFAPFQFFRQGADGLFAEVSWETGLYDPQSHGYGLSWADFDGDGDTDCFISNCGVNPISGQTVDRLHLSIQAQTGLAIVPWDTGEAGLNYAGNMWGNEACDPDNDGDWDIFVAGAKPDQLHRFYENTGSFPWADSAGEYGLQGPESAIGFGVECIDYDNDADLDIWVHAIGVTHLFQNQLSDTGSMSFMEVGSDILFFPAYLGYDGSWGDLDSDGDLDLVLARQGRNTGFNQVLINEGGNANNWLFVDLKGSSDTLSGTGAVIKVRTGATTQMRTHGGQAGGYTQNALPSHFGLGQATVVDEITVEWLTQSPQTIPGPIAINQRITIEQPPPGITAFYH